MGATQGTVHVRRNAWTLAEGDQTLAAYAAAVAAMRARDDDDPTSWAYQGAMHGTDATPPQALWNGCQHGSWFFLAWHRMYLYFFERIVRAAVVETGGPEDWALPFWDYGAGGQQATIPLAFRDATDAGGGDNALFVTQRRRGVNQGLAVPPVVGSPAGALARPQFVGIAEFGGGVTEVGQFWGATGRVEQTPHNDIHNVLGGPGGWMADPFLAALDPIFWLHHANIDRIWFVWNGDDPSHTDPVQRSWSGQAFSFFDADGQQVQLTGEQIGDIAGQLGYTYEPAPTAEPPAPREELEAAMSTPNPPGPGPEKAEIVGASQEPVQLVGNAASVTVPIDQPTLESLGGGMGAGLEAQRERHVYLNVEDIEAERNPGSVYGIYVNLPDGATPEQAERHHVGNVSFFGIERARNPRGDEHGHGLRVTVEITELARELAVQDGWDEQQLHVTFRPIGLVDPDQPELQHEQLESASADPPVQIGRVSLFYG